MRPIRIWDLPTRFFHWTLVACVVGLVVTGNIGGNVMVWHFRLGYTVLTLLLFRLVWGLGGGRWSRFSSFIYAPSTVLAYLRGERKPEWTAGHNPLGALSVFAMLVFLLAQVGTGLFSDDEIAAAGPMTRFVADSTISLATWYHKNVGKTVLIVLVVLHILAIGFYWRAKKENLVRPMWNGDKALADDAGLEASRDSTASRLAAVAILGLCAGAVAWLVSLGS